jgi:adenosine deaminase
MPAALAGEGAFLQRFRGAPKTELHLHLEGAVAPATLVKLSRRVTNPIFPDSAAVRARRGGLGSSERFLGLYRDVCRQLRSPADYALVAGDLARRLRRENIGHAEVYVSPAIVEKIGLDWYDVQEAIENVFADHEHRGGGRIRVLLDSVRHWGPRAAGRVLTLHERRPWGRAVGFSLGGDESAVPARAFAGIYSRARRLGLFPLVHAGEWAGPDSVAEAVKYLRPVRIAHGIQAVEDPALLRLLARKRIALDVCPTSNYLTGALAGGTPHPARALLAAGIAVTISTDDPGLFGTTLLNEYRLLARQGATARELTAFAASSRQAALRTRS